MRTKMKLKTATDLLMSVALLLLMAYESTLGNSIENKQERVDFQK